MELLQLHYFRTVAQLEHMTKAAEQLRIAQPALSKTIARLEEDLGVPLFRRNGRQIRLNEYGRSFLQRVELVLSTLEEGRRELEDMAGLNQGRIEIAIQDPDRIGEPLKLFSKKYPNAKFGIIQATHHEMESLLNEDRIDYCMSSLPIAASDIQSEYLTKEIINLALPPNHPFSDRDRLQLSEVKQEHFVGYKETHALYHIQNEFCRKSGISPNFVCRVDEPSMLLKMVEAGIGVAFVSSCIRDWSPQVQLVSIVDEHSKALFRLTWHKNRYLSKAALAFKQFLIDYYMQGVNLNEKLEDRWQNEEKISSSR
ncbi:LysR family transcriptional regulator [Paenibacillus shunpengii]|uniref:LysR family transcriptional regulator n=1 Tax=Paenibacillus shunpengii TaxID=2054424 RepID=A0ABW5SLR1_9BACL